MLDYFPTKQGISSYLSPRSIVAGETLQYKKHLTLHSGQYCLVYYNEGPRNTDKARSQGVISLGLCGNLQVGFKFMILQTGHKIARYHWD